MSCRSKARSDTAILDWLETFAFVAGRRPSGEWAVVSSERGQPVALGSTLRAAASVAMGDLERADCLPPGCTSDCYGLPKRRAGRTQIGD